jgi:hypothetical protein
VKTENRRTVFIRDPILIRQPQRIRTSSELGSRSRCIPRSFFPSFPAWPPRPRPKPPTSRGGRGAKRAPQHNHLAVRIPPFLSLGSFQSTRPPAAATNGEAAAGRRPLIFLRRRRRRGPPRRFGAEVEDACVGSRAGAVPGSERLQEKAAPREQRGEGTPPRLGTRAVGLLEGDNHDLEFGWAILRLQKLCAVRSSVVFRLLLGQ